MIPLKRCRLVLCCLHTETELFCIGSECVFIWLNRSYPTQTVMQINFEFQTKIYTILKFRLKSSFSDKDTFLKQLDYLPLWRG